MAHSFRVAVVDDNTPQRMILTRLLEKDYQVTSFDGGMAFLNDNEPFDAVLLDIEMPGINGYDTCRQYRAQTRSTDVPIIFVSAHDTTPERVAAYEAGGDDFLTKPIAANELRYKLNNAIELRAKVRALTNQSSDAQRAAFSAMHSMGDLGVVIEFLRKSALAANYSTIAARLIAAMKSWGLHGAVQVRGRYDQVALTAEGPITTMQAAVLEKLRDIGRVFEMGSRAVINFDHVSLLVENLPIDDSDKLGRLRDHLAILAESADMRMAALDAATERELQKQGIEAALDELRVAMQQATQYSGSSHRKGQAALLESIERLARTIETLSLTEVQSGYMEDLIRHAMDETQRYFDEVAENESVFADVIARLQRLAQADYRL